MSYEFKQEDLYSLIRAQNADTVTKGKEIQFKYCPYCEGGDHHDKYTFSVNIETGCYNCKRGKCGVSGYFVQLARDMNFPLTYKPAERKYKKLRQREIETRDEAVEYMKSRGIPEEITRRYKITVSITRKNILVMPFFDDKGEMVSIKYRKTDFMKGVDKCKEWSDSGTKPVLYGMWLCRDTKKPLIITEGQIDSLSVASCGLDNAVSVPTGAHGFTWIDNCYDFVEKFQEIIIFGDCENGEITLVDGISKRFPKKMIKVVRPQDYLGEKDANDILRKYGKDAILTAIGNAEVRPVKAVKELDKAKSVNLMQAEHLKTGILQIDKAIGGLYLGQVGLLTGRRGEGKSTFASQICANVLDDDTPIFVYSGELPDYHFKYWLDLQIAGNDNIEEYLNDYHEPEYAIPEKVLASINSWYRGRAYIFDNSVVTDEGEEISLLNTIEEAICRYGVKFILIDNLMTAIEVGDKDDLFLSQSRFVKALKRIATKWSVFILLVAHPRKENGKELNNESVSGTGDITNAVDIVFTYSRNTGEDRAQYQSLIGIVKNRLTGKILVNDNRIKVAYSAKSKRIAATEAEQKRVYKAFLTDALDDYEEL